MTASDPAPPLAGTSSSLTPVQRSGEAVNAAFMEGAINGVLTMIPFGGAMYIALQRYPRFAARTNWQSRTAMVIMPGLFSFGLTSEHKMGHTMRQMALENQHNVASVEWAEKQVNQQQQQLAASIKSQQQQQDHISHQPSLSLTQLYHQSIVEQGVRIVPGDTLGWHHVTANYVAANPFKVLAALAIPSVAWIFYGRTGKDHLQFSVKLLHTRVFGQFATITILLGLMGFKEFMDQHGRFITQADADARVAEMQMVRARLMATLEREKQHEFASQQELREAHEQDVLEQQQHPEHPVTKGKGKKRHKKDRQDGLQGSMDAIPNHEDEVA